MSAIEVDRAKQFASLNHVDFEVRSATVDRLSTICADHDFLPDLIKVDIEGFEFEMVMSSLEFIGDLKPHISLELHVNKLRERGKSVELLLEKMSSLGYKLAWSGRPLAGMLADVESDGAARAAIVAS